MSESTSTIEIGLEFLTLRAAVRTDEPKVGAFCRDLFSRFLDSNNPADYAIHVISAEPNGGSWRVRDGTVDAIVHEESWLTGIVTARLLETVGNEVRDHDLFHAAALSRAGRGLILSGESGFGKSVLTLGLLGRGWEFFSDEVAALHIADGLLVPFPKAIEVRPQAGTVLGWPLNGTARRGGKLLCDAEVLFPGCLSQPSPPAAIVFLESSETRRERAERGTLRLLVHRRAEGLTEAVAELDGVIEVSWDKEGPGFATLFIKYEHGRFAAWRLDDLLGRHGVLLMESSAEETPPVHFERTPSLSPMESHAGVAKLLGRFRGRRALARRIEMNDGNFAELFVAFLERLKDARFYQLKVGRLEEMLGLLEQAVDWPSGGSRA